MVSRRSYLVTIVIRTVFPALAETFAVELAPFKIPVLLVAPGAFATEGIYGQGCRTHNAIAAYDVMREATRSKFFSLESFATGDPDKAMEAVVDVVKGQGVANGKPWPLYLILGKDANRDVEIKCGKVLGALDEWKDVTQSMDFDKA